MPSQVTTPLNQLKRNLWLRLQTRVQEYTTQKQLITAVTRKATGSLAIKDLAQVVDPRDIVATENLITLIVTVPHYNYKEFMASYETLCSFVVPRSAKTVAQDNDYYLVRVVLFQRVVDDFKLACRGKGCQVPSQKASTDTLCSPSASSSVCC